MEMNFAEFKATPILSAFPENILQQLYHLMEEKRYPAGYFVIQEGEQGDSFFIVASGELEVRKTINQQAGEYKVLTRIGPKEILGEMAVFDQSTRSADVVALTDVVLWQITVPSVKGLLQSDPAAGADFLMSMITLLISRLRITNQTLTVLAEAGRLVSAAPDLPTLTRLLFDLITREFEGADSAMLATYNWFNDEFNVVESMERGDSKIPPMTFESSDPFILRLKNSPEPILIHQDVVLQHAESLKREGVLAEARSVLAAPFWYGNTLFGFVLLMNFTKEDRFIPQQLVLLDGICHLVSPAMETFRYRLDEEARMRLSTAKGAAYGF
jgi:CRP-like cAMP-binding protein